VTLSTAQRVRLRIQDQPRIADITRAGDGSASVFDLEHQNLSSGSAWVQGGGGWTATGATFNATGFVQFAEVLTNQRPWRVRYVYSVFSDDEIDQFIADGGSIAGAALEAAKVLQWDALKRAVWVAPDGTQYDDTKAIAQVQALYNQLREEVFEETADDGGGYIEWSQNQAEWE